jgi:uncharacterized protein (DUF1800 family)
MLVSSETAGQVAHVSRRMGFGPVPAEIAEGVKAGPAAVIDDLLSRPLTSPAEWKLPTSTDWEAQVAYLGQQMDLMATSPNPLQERLAWIMQGLVVVGLTDFVYFADLQGHVARLRTNPFGSYTELLADTAIFPGMMKYLSGYLNSAAHPNQNYGRELMELFSLGLLGLVTGTPNYSQQDVIEVAAACTGYTYDWSNGTISFDPSLFDDSEKYFLGKARGRADLADVIAAVSTHPAYPHFVPARLYRELVGLDPDRATLLQLGRVFGATGDVRAVVSAIVKSPQFLSAAAIGSKIKTPVELIVSGARVTGYDLSTSNYGWQMSSFMNQHPFYPPNVSGWPVGKVWLNAGVAMTWGAIVQDYVTASAAASKGVVAQLLGSASARTAPAAAAALCGITTLSPVTERALASYAAGATWNLERAAGTLALVLVSPEFAVN